MTDTEKNNIKEFWDNGLSTSQISQKLNLTTKVVYRFLKRNGWYYKRNLQKDEFSNSNNSKWASKIFELRNQGKTYKEIQDILHCSKSIISYHLKTKTREKVKECSNKYPKWKQCFMRNVSTFFCREKIQSQIKIKNPIKKTYWRKIIRDKCKGFKRNMPQQFNYEQVLEKIGGTTTKCYLTGRTIDITKDLYEFDHIIPYAKGGSCTLDNLGITCPEANRSKTNLTLDEYLSLCKEVLENFGYKVIKD